MLRQLARLTRPLPAAGPTALAVAVYAAPDGTHLPAQDLGFEGVACVDDAARLLGLLTDIWDASRLPAIGEWARGLQEFVLWMQEEPGYWLNFVEDWDGTRNVRGITSSSGENFWQARAMQALALSSSAFGDPGALEAVHAGLERARKTEVPSDVRALHLRLVNLLARRGWKVEADVRRWADEIASTTDGPFLMNNPDERGQPHLWAHLQEGALADASILLDDPSLLQVAERSANALIVPVVRDGFSRPSTTPYDVTCVAWSCERLAEARPEGPWASVAADARAWFDGRNAASRAVYDRARGRVADGIDGTDVSENSGAEANIEGGRALFADAVASAAAIAPGPTLR